MTRARYLRETLGFDLSTGARVRCSQCEALVINGTPARPYIAHKRGKLFLGSDDGDKGTVCLWPGGIAPAYREPVVAEYFPMNDASAALAAARDVLKRARDK